MPNTYQVRLLKERLSGVLGVLVVIAALTLGSLGTNAQTYTDLHDFDPTSDAGFGLYDGMVAQGRDGNFYGTLPQGSFGASYGTVYKVTPSGTFTVLHTFTGTDGTTPYSGLTLGTDGNFYGTTFSGGTYGWGTIFKITPSGTFTTLHVFTGADGCAAYGPPVQGKGLVFYGVTQCLTAYSITPSGTFKLLPNTLPNGVYGTPILASDGNFYGTSFLGGNGNLGTVYRLTPSGVVTIIYSFDSTHGAEPIGPVVQGKDGNLYGVTAYGGTAANPGGVVFKMTLNGSISVLHNFDSKSNTDGANPYGGLVLGSDGNFYSGTFSGSSGTAAQYGNLYKITPSGVYSNLYDFDLTHGATVGTTPTQHTNGILYGESYRGGANGYGTFWELNAGLPPFVSIVGFPAGSSGATVEILGQGFTTASSVAFGDAAATFTVVSDTYLTAKVPSSGTTGPITVTTNGGTPTSRQSFRVLPVISGFSPATGPVGTQVTITGSGFIGTTAVAFNGVKASFTVNSATQITAIVPSGATTGAIAIRTAGGTAVSKTSFTVM